jgi:hypothetical protein
MLALQLAIAVALAGAEAKPAASAIQELGSEQHPGLHGCDPTASSVVACSELCLSWHAPNRSGTACGLLLPVCSTSGSRGPDLDPATEISVFMTHGKVSDLAFHLGCELQLDVQVAHGAADLTISSLSWSGVLGSSALEPLMTSNGSAVEIRVDFKNSRILLVGQDAASPSLPTLDLGSRAPAPSVSTDRMLMVSPGQMLRERAWEYEGIPYSLGVDDDGIVQYISTSSPSVEKPERAHVGETLAELGTDQLVKVNRWPGWGYVANLPSGWKAAMFLDGNSTERSPAPSDRVDLLFKGTLAGYRADPCKEAAAGDEEVFGDFVVVPTGSSSSAPASRAATANDAPQARGLVLVGTITEIVQRAEGGRSLKPWAVTVHVDRIVSGDLSGPSFTFAIHSPALAGLEVGRSYTIKATWTQKGYSVDEAQWDRP